MMRWLLRRGRWAGLGLLARYFFDSRQGAQRRANAGRLAGRATGSVRRRAGRSPTV